MKTAVPTTTALTLTLTAMLASTLVHAKDSPETEFSSVEIEGLPATLLVTPDGTGPTLADIGVTITVHVATAQGPIADFPLEDVSIVPWGQESGFVLCQLQRTQADADTDATGTTTITGTIIGGGWTDGEIVVSVAGIAIPTPLGLRIVSPDLNRDLVVDLVDVAEFGMDFRGTYQWRSDLRPDGVLDLRDISVLATHLGESCP